MVREIRAVRHLTAYPDKKRRLPWEDVRQAAGKEARHLLSPPAAAPEEGAFSPFPYAEIQEPADAARRRCFCSSGHPGKTTPHRCGWLIRSRRSHRLGVAAPLTRRRCRWSQRVSSALPQHRTSAMEAVLPDAELGTQADVHGDCRCNSLLAPLSLSAGRGQADPLPPGAGRNGSGRRLS